MHEAARKGNVGLMRYLGDMGADVNIIGGSGVSE